MKKYVLLLSLLITVPVSGQKTSGLSLTPPMGWCAWNKSISELNETSVHEIADFIVSSGMKDAGYEYVNIADCWQSARDKNGNILSDSVKFPSGMKALADYLHSKGLKLGILTSAGKMTCKGKPGSFGYEKLDADQYASWGIDLLTVDFCNSEGINPELEYSKLSRAIAATGRPMVFSISDNGNSNPWFWAKEVGHLWRTGSNILDCWGCEQTAKAADWTYILDQQEGLEKFSGPGHWNNPDVLLAGNNGLKSNEYIAQFSFWCLLNAPLFASNDLRNMSQETRDIILNKDAISINQDPLGIQGSKKLDDGQYEVWTKPLSGGDFAVILFNRGFWAAKVSVDADVKWKDFGIQGEYKVLDIWSRANLGIIDGYKGSIPLHSVIFLRLTKSY